MNPLGLCIRHSGLVALVILLVTVSPVRETSAQPVNGTEDQQVLSVETSEFLHITTPQYLSITISGGQLRKGLIGYDFSAWFRSQKLKNLAKALAPADVRIGGTYNDFLHFDPTSNPDNCVDVDSVATASNDTETEGNDTMPVDTQETKEMEGLDFTLSGVRWDNISTFCDQAGWNILWDFNLLLRRNGTIDPEPAREFLEYSFSRGMPIPMFELGNEPNLYERKFEVDIEAEALATDYAILRNMISQMPMYSGSGMYAPGVNNLDTFKGPRKYLARFLESGGCNLITEVSLHHYYFKASEAHLSDFYDLDVMEGLRTELEFAYNITWPSCNGRRIPIRFTETSTASGGGVKDVSNAFVAGFLWLDKLGLSATFGVTRVFRQTFLKSSYALVTQKLKPNPDYYLSVMYKRLVEGPVFRVDIEFLSPLVRVYAHCVSRRYTDIVSYPIGAMVVYYLNVDTEPNELSLGDYGKAPVDLYQFTAGDGGDLLSRNVNLNGNLLEMVGDDLPPMEPVHHSEGPVTLPPMSYGFIVVPNANIQLCKNYHRTDNGVDPPC